MELFDDAMIINRDDCADQLTKMIGQTISLTKINQIYAKSRTGGTLKCFDKNFNAVNAKEDAYYIVFDTGLPDASGKMCHGFFIKALKTKQGWKGLYWTIEGNLRSQILSQKPGNALKQWAFIHFGEYEKLAKLALKEKWHFGTSTVDSPGQFRILDSYLKNTFYRLIQLKDSTGKDDYILESENAALFNTGLVDKFYDPIYAFFKINKRGPQKWILDVFDTGKENYGKTLSQKFKNLPKEAHYYDASKINDILYDIGAGEPEPKWNHVLYDHPERLPQKLIEMYCPEGFHYLDSKQLDQKSHEDKDAYYRSLKKALENDDNASRRIRFEIENAIKIAFKRVKWNFKTAIPSYFPTLDSMNLLLPLSISTGSQQSEDQVDVALVVSKNRQGNYDGNSLLPLDQAYSNARLVCRPDSDWLDPKYIKSKTDDEGIL